MGSDTKKEPLGILKTEIDLNIFNLNKNTYHKQKIFCTVQIQNIDMINLFKLNSYNHRKGAKYSLNTVLF